MPRAWLPYLGAESSRSWKNIIMCIGIICATARADLLGLEALGLLLRYQEGKRFEFEAVTELPALLK